jgi:hypothetical protein
MAYRYRTETVETGNVIEPSWWNANMGELASEFNGGLDRDNLPLAGVTQARLAEDACNSIVNATGSSSSSYTPSVETTGWQGSTEISVSTLEVTVDSLLIIEWSGNWTWAGISTAGSFDGSTPTEDAVEWRITVDGSEAAVTGPIGDQRWKDSVWLCAAVPVAPGPHTVAIECRIAERDFDGLSVNDKATNDLTLNDRELVITQRKR